MISKKIVNQLLTIERVLRPYNFNAHIHLCSHKDNEHMQKIAEELEFTYTELHSVSGVSKMYRTSNSYPNITFFLYQEPGGKDEPTKA